MKKTILAIAAAAFLVTGLSTKDASANDQGLFGTLLGGAAGGYIGSNIGSGKGQLAATAAGALIGAMVGNELGNNMAQPRRRNVVYNPVYKPEPRRVVYKPVHVYDDEPRYERPRVKRKVVVHKHHVTVKHVGEGHGKKWRKKRGKAWEKYRRKLARQCYDHPRRCAKAFDNDHRGHRGGYAN